MNRHKYMAYQTVNDEIDNTLPMIHKVGGELSGWMFSDACSHVKCPRCSSDPGYECQAKSGRRVWPPHGIRQTELLKHVYPESYKFLLG